jgi:hypothetical protein
MNREHAAHAHTRDDTYTAQQELSAHTSRFCLRRNAPTYFDGGIVDPTVSLALRARQQFGWAGRVPRDLFESAVLPYANVNEARSDWRQLFWDTLTAQPWVTALHNESTLEEVAVAVNANVWRTLGNLTRGSPITFKSEQTPLIFDPLSTVLFGFASCTGISITFVDALRCARAHARHARTIHAGESHEQRTRHACARTHAHIRCSCRSRRVARCRSMAALWACLRGSWVLRRGTARLTTATTTGALTARAGRDTVASRRGRGVRC